MTCESTCAGEAGEWCARVYTMQRTRASKLNRLLLKRNLRGLYTTTNVSSCSRVQQQSSCLQQGSCVCACVCVWVCACADYWFLSVCVRVWSECLAKCLHKNLKQRAVCCCHLTGLIEDTTHHVRSSIYRVYRFSSLQGRQTRQTTIRTSNSSSRYCWCGDLQQQRRRRR